MSASAGPISVGAVDVEQVDVAVDLAERVVRERPHVTDPIVDARRSQVLVEHVVVDRRLVLEPVDLLRSTVVARMRVDGDDLDPVGRRRCQDHRRSAAKRPDLHDPVTDFAIRRHGPTTGAPGRRSSNRRPSRPRQVPRRTVPVIVFRPYWCRLPSRRGDAAVGRSPTTAARASRRSATSPPRRACAAIHMLSWRDLADVEAGGSEVHAANVARLWAEAGIEVTLRTSYAQGQAPVVTRDGYRVIRRAGRYLVFPRAAGSEMIGRHGPSDALVEIWNGMPFFSPVWRPGARHRAAAPRPRRDVEDGARRRGAVGRDARRHGRAAHRAARLPPVARSSRCRSRRRTTSSSSCICRRRTSM